MNKHNNSRYLATDKRIRDAALGLMSSNKEVTVSEISRICGINRSSFYEHYPNIEELFRQITPDDLEAIIGEEFPRIHDAYKYRDTESLCHQILAHAKKRKSRYLGYLKKHNALLLKVTYELFWKESEEPIPESDIFKYECANAAFSNTIRIWLEGDCKEDEEIVLGIINKYIDVK